MSRDPTNTNLNLPAPLGAEVFSIEALNDALAEVVSKLNKFPSNIAMYHPPYATQEQLGEPLFIDYIMDYLFPRAGATVEEDVFDEDILETYDIDELKDAVVDLKGITDAPNAPATINGQSLRDYVYFYFDGSYQYEPRHYETAHAYDEDEEEEEYVEDSDEDEDPTTGPPQSGGRRRRNPGQKRQTRRKQKRVTRRKAAAHKRKTRSNQKRKTHHRRRHQKKQSSRKHKQRK